MAVVYLMKAVVGAALATAAAGSFVAGTISTLLLTFVAPAIARLALLFQPADYFSLTVLAFMSVTALVGKSLLRCLVNLFIGLVFRSFLCAGMDFLLARQSLA